MLDEPEDKNRNELVENLDKTNPIFTSIGKNSSSIQSEDVKTLNNGKKHYLCSNCKSLHLIKIDDGKIIIECNKKGKIKLGDFLSNNILDLEKIDNFKLCLIHKENEKIGFCPKCKKDLCQRCKEENDCENNKRHDFLDFKAKSEEISKKEKFILYALKKEDKKKTENSSNPGTVNISEKAKFLKVDEKKEIKIIEKKGFTECLNEIMDLKQFIQTLIISKVNIPSYINYENIIILYHFFCDKLKLYYYSYSNNQIRIRLFGEKFIKNNINKCSVMINNELKKIEDCEFYELEDIKKGLNITLLKEDDIIDMSYMFNDCEVLQSISEESKWSTNSVINMSYMFCNCKALTSLPKMISDWDTSKVTDMSNMFSGCDSLSEIENISNWNTSKVENMQKMFYECNFFECLENIMIWETKNVTNMSYMFYNCLGLKNIDIENEKNNKAKWNTEKVENMSYMFYGCESLKRLPDHFSDLKTSKVKYMMYMFYNCKSLKILPDISKWETGNVLYMNNMFENCYSLESFPNIDRWNIASLISIDFLIEGCTSTSLKTLNLSKWNKVKYKKGELLDNCLKGNKI